jgi:hypothetical protein
VDRNYYRPRVSRTTGEIVVAEQANDRWRIALVSPVTGALRYVDPEDGASRYDATFARDGRTIVATSEAGGIANLERFDTTGTRPIRLTSVTGAAVAPDVAPDGTIWFLSLEGRGYDLRRLQPDSVRRGAALDIALRLADSLSPVLPPRLARAAGDSSRRPALAPVPDESPYGNGPTRVRYLPASTTGFGGSTTQLAIVRSDPVGRLGVALLGSVGSASLPEGGALTIISRRFRTELTASGWISHEAPSREYAAAADYGLDLSRAGGALRAERTRVGDGDELTGIVALLAEQQRPSNLPSAGRTAVIGAFGTELRQRDDEVRYQEELAFMSEAGRTFGGAYVRQRAAFTFGTAARTRALTTLRLGYGSIGGGDGSIAERFVVGGFASPLIDPLYDARRVEAPAYPVGSAVGSTFSSYRAALPLEPFELFYAGVSTDLFRHPLRSYGAELRQRIPAIAALGTPMVDVLTGVARAVDEPAKGAWRYYVTLVLRP